MFLKIDNKSFIYTNKGRLLEYVFVTWKKKKKNWKKENYGDVFVRNEKSTNRKINEIRISNLKKRIIF